MEKELVRKGKTKEAIRKLGSVLEQIAVVVLLLLCTVIFAGLTFYCARYTWMEQDGIPYEIRDSALKNLAIGILPALGMFLLYRLSQKGILRSPVERIRNRLPYIIAGVTLGIYLFSAFWVSQCHIAPSGDGLSLCQAALLVSGSEQLVRIYYEKLSGIEISDGAPYISWVRMGLQDSLLGPGWFDNSSVEAFAEHGYDTEATARAERERLGERLQEMTADPAGSFDFFRHCRI